MLISRTIAQIRLLDGNPPEETGENDLIFVEFAEPIDINDERIATRPLRMRTAPLHLHVGSQHRTLRLRPQQIASMFVIGDWAHLREALFLTFVKTLPEVAHWDCLHEVAAIRVVGERADRCRVHVSPVTLHLAGPFHEALFPYDLIDDMLPVQGAPKKPHVCRQEPQFGTQTPFRELLSLCQTERPIEAYTLPIFMITVRHITRNRQ